MGQIEVDGDAYERARQTLAQAADALSAAGGKLGSAVPGLAFGPLAAFIPPGFNALGGVVEGASGIVGARAQRTSEGIATALSGFQRVEDAAQADAQRLEGDL